MPRTGAGLLIEALELWVGESLYLAHGIGEIAPHLGLRILLQLSLNLLDLVDNGLPRLADRRSVGTRHPAWHATSLPPDHIVERRMRGDEGHFSAGRRRVRSR